MKLLRIAVLALFAGCAATQSIELLPRGDAKRGSGSIDRLKNEIRVAVDGRDYAGTMQLNSASSTSWGPFGPRTTTATSNQATALLIGAQGGQMRCEFSWNAPMTQATGVCVDNNGATYDLLISQ
jgi:hypothetical protein